MEERKPEGPEISRRDFFQSLFKGLASAAGNLGSPLAKGLAVAAAADPAGPTLAVVDNARCSMGQGVPCDACVKVCPVSPKAITVSAVGLSAGVNSSLCTGCGDCVAACPVQAIATKPRG